MNRQDQRAGLQETHDKDRKALTKYDPKMALRVIERLANGETLRSITAKKQEPEMVSRVTFMKWVSTVPELGEAYRYAMEISAHAMEEEALDEARNRRDEPGSAQKVTASNNLIRQLQWSAERRDPGRYGQKNNAALIVPVTINTTLDLPESKKVVSESPDFYKLSVPIEGEYSEIEKEEDGLTVFIPEEEKSEEPSPPIDFAAILRVDEPVVGTERQPLLHRPRISTRKRVLIPPGERVKE